ncbi:acyl-CoA dehydrogenase C-terminal domain-containing protein [Variovorax fucosicus]|uniref:acyl-CoA dehydrogenase C-terminal domain-containing protein n=1 Tax=Variovorax fucosicus TaxID=3053517 RepID=UPI0033659C10
MLLRRFPPRKRATVAGGWQMARAALAATRLMAEDGSDQAFLRAKVLTARFYADHVLPRAHGLGLTVVSGAVAALAIEDDSL